MDLSSYRPNVGVVLFRADGKVWLGRRAATPGPFNWQFPQGGVDNGEELHAAALRELAEETGVTSVSLLGRTEGWIVYDFPPGHKGSKAARGWKGQKQVWFAFRFEGDDSEIDLNADHDGHGDVEFDAWRWADFTEALDFVVPFKREAYQRVIQAFTAFAQL
jgi:putative (di)nucleoside polyphosphate hydrolase